MPHPWAVHDAATGALVGFTMISDNIPQPMDDDLVGPYYLWKLLIDEPLQRHGYGAATLDAVVDYLGTRPGADVLYTSCADGPGSPRGFYLRYGFTDTGGSCGARTCSRSTSPSPDRRGQASRIVKSSSRRRSASASQSISTILPPLTVKAPTEKGWPSRIATTPTAPFTSAGFMASSSRE